MRLFATLALAASLIILAGCGRRDPSAPLAPDVEAYAVERTPDAYARFQDARSRLLHIREGERVLGEELRKIGRSAQDDPTMQEMRRRGESVRLELEALRTFIESNYLRERKFLLGLTEDGIGDTAVATPAASRPLIYSRQPTSPPQPSPAPEQQRHAVLPKNGFVPENARFFRTDASGFQSGDETGNEGVLVGRWVIESDEGLEAFKAGTRVRIVRFEDPFLVVLSDDNRTFRLPASLVRGEHQGSGMGRPARLNLWEAAPGIIDKGRLPSETRGGEVLDGQRMQEFEGDGKRFRK